MYFQEFGEMASHQVAHVPSDTNPAKFQACLDVHQFAPDEIKVKTVGRYAVVECQHEERRDEHGYIERHFVRKYLLPEDVEPNDVVSSLSSDGVLTLSVRNPIVLPDKHERIVPIRFTGSSRNSKDHRVDHEVARVPHRHLHCHHGQAASSDNDKKVILAIKYI